MKLGYSKLLLVVQSSIEIARDTGTQQETTETDNWSMWPQE